jgi:hypothetical protein
MRAITRGSVPEGCWRRRRFISDWSQVRIQQMEWTGLKLLLGGIETGT